MRMPLEVFETAWKRPEEFDGLKEELSLLLGSRLRTIEEFRRLGVRITRLSTSRGIRYPGKPYKDVLFFYKDLSADYYVRYPLLSAMRGSVVREYENGDVRQVAFPFAKFFNLGEVDATKNLPEGDFLVTEKLDGSLIVVWVDPDTGEIRYSTRGMLDQHAVLKGSSGYYVSATPGKVSNPYVVRFINSVKRMQLWYELERMVREDRTLMFELVYKIPASHGLDVFETPEDSPDWRPYFLAYRDHASMKVVYDSGTAFPTPEVYPVRNVREAMEVVESEKSREGVVIYYPGRIYRYGLPWWSYMVKLKNRAYLLQAYIRAGKITWKQLAVLVVTGRADDVIPMLDEEKAAFIKDYTVKYREFVDAWRDFAETVLSLKDRYGDRVERILVNSLKSGNLLKYIRRVEKAWGTGDYDGAVEATARSLVLDYLVYKNSREAMINALDRFMRRLERVKEALTSMLGS